MHKKTVKFSKNKSSELKVPVSKQTAGGVTGAVLGGMVAGPVGAIVGGVAGAMVGDASAQGKRPMKKALDNAKTLARSRRARTGLAKIKTRARQAATQISRASSKVTRSKKLSKGRKRSSMR